MNQEIDITANIKNRSQIKALSGRNLGKDQRRNLKIDDILDHAKSNEKITIKIPDNIYSVSSSFFLGMFGDIVRRFKTRDAFLGKIEFKCSQSVRTNIDDGIHDALNNVDALV